MARGTGVDIIEISRIRESIKRYQSHFLNKIFTEYEQQYCMKHRDPAPHFAGRFAAKEAIVKALGGFREQLAWTDIEIRNDAGGQPKVLLSPHIHEALLAPQFLISISHCREYATAIAILL